MIVLLASMVLAEEGSPQGPPSAPRPPGGPNGHERRSDRSWSGTYQIVVSGEYHGAGTAVVTEKTVSIKAEIRTDDGTLVTLKADSLPISGPYFRNDDPKLPGPVCTLGDAKVTVRGRLDAAKASRLVASISPGPKSEKHTFARIIGTLPADPGNPNWKDGGGNNTPGTNSEPR